MKHIALVFDLNKEWVGGSYYIRNLVSALKLLPDAEQPMLTLLSNERESVDFIAQTGYPHLNWVRISEFEERPNDFPFDALFPWPIFDQDWRTISWIPDFQELHLPYYFSQQEINERRTHHRIRFNTAGLVVSSEDVKKDVQLFYPGECDNVAVVRFATFDPFDTQDVDRIKQKYNLQTPYVMCANQVWIHKNHLLVVKAIAILKEQGINISVCFTGNESDYRVQGYTHFLKKMVADWGVRDQVKFLGFLPRQDQLTLMYGAEYVLQPSLFEGWSTVIEDAKAMHQFIVASDLDVHKEQLTHNCRFFARHNPHSLAEVMRELWFKAPAKDLSVNYDDARVNFGRNFMSAVEDFLPSGHHKPQHGVSVQEIENISSRNMNTS